MDEICGGSGKCKSDPAVSRVAAARLPLLQVLGLGPDTDDADLFEAAVGRIADLELDVEQLSGLVSRFSKSLAQAREFGARKWRAARHARSWERIARELAARPVLTEAEIDACCGAYNFPDGGRGSLREYVDRIRELESGFLGVRVRDGVLETVLGPEGESRPCPGCGEKFGGAHDLCSECEEIRRLSGQDAEIAMEAAIDVVSHDVVFVASGMCPGCRLPFLPGSPCDCEPADDFCEREDCPYETPGRCQVCGWPVKREG